ncbi:hypothetical protein C8N24_0740 [Solirubrobacter pauli]|uniref:Uncharacterized protein n=1 Tax=Solirubrobacter pauli TaxID=166793 RepID=A0A660L9J0_9ACTN|nr:hypothetical protein [Solirubrobacter pauli]RKQ90925.1 hypothetical protein C8N24_0740 [Solirubrobacter pauli]
MTAGRLTGFCLVLAIGFGGCGSSEPDSTATGAPVVADGGNKIARTAATTLQDAMLTAQRSLDSTTGTRSSLARAALKLRAASSQTSDAIAMLSATSEATVPELAQAAKHQRDYLEAMESAATSRSRTDVRQALRGAQSAGRAAGEAYVEIGRGAPDLAGSLPESSSFRVAEMRSATAAALPRAKPKARKLSAGSTPGGAAPAADGGSRTFHAPSGNVACTVSAETAACTVASLSQTFVLPASGAGFLESGTRVGRGAGQSVGYGSSVRMGSITCSVPAQNVAGGITCTNANTGHGFEASRVSSRQKLF